MSIYVIYAYLDEFGIDGLKKTSLKKIKQWKVQNWQD